MMPQLSRRISTLNTDGKDGWELYREARDRAAAGEQIIELTIGEHDIGTDGSILEAMHASAMQGHTGYAIVPGTDALRDTIAARVAIRTGVPTKRENVIVMAGGQAALFATHLLTVGDGDAALHVDPYYATYPGTIRAAGGRPVPLPTRADQAFVPQEQEVDLAFRNYRAKSLLINSPNNPTGVVYPQSALEGIARAVQRNDGWLISDEVYDAQVWSGTHISPRALPGMVERTLVIGSMSKSHAMTGSRIGWIIAPEAAVTALTNLSTNTTYGVPGYIQDAALYALRRGSGLERGIAAPFGRRLQLLEARAEASHGAKLLPGGGAMYAMLDIRATGLTGQGFARRLLDEHKIAVMPGESFGSSAAGHVRVALTVSDELLSFALDKLFGLADSLAAAAA
jgi:arginine:pyruvate transaminase